MLALATAEANRPLRTRSMPREENKKISFPARSTTSLSTLPARSFSLKGVLSFTKNKKKRLSTTPTNSAPIFQLQVRQQAAPNPHTEQRELRSPLTSLSLLSLHANEPWLQVETSDFDSSLDNAVRQLQNDFTSGARQLADASLRHLAHLSDTVACVSRAWCEFWGLLVYAAKRLGGSRPSMSAAINACLLRALERIARKWTEGQTRDGRQSPSDLACIAQSTFDEILRERKQLGCQLGTKFAQWLHHHCAEIKDRNTIRILTLSNSSTIHTAILHALSVLSDVMLHITILESRPRCEGADMAAQIYHSHFDRNRLSIRIIPDCAVGTAAQDIDIVLLGADRISPTGDLSNKIGSLAAVLCARMVNEKVAIVALSDSEKIAATEQDAEAIEHHPSSELTSAWSPGTRTRLANQNNVEIFDEWFEWVPARYIDAYVTEKGVLKTEEVKAMAKQIEALDKYIFQSQNV